MKVSSKSNERSAVLFEIICMVIFAVAGAITAVAKAFKSYFDYKKEQKK